jgi:isocitrate/isopropylmalate dehydrogenase
MLDWLNEKDTAQRIEAAVDQALADGCMTPDLGGSLGTDKMTDAIIERLA